jgi:hypothetical protein
VQVCVCVYGVTQGDRQTDRKTLCERDTFRKWYFFCYPYRLGGTQKASPFRRHGRHLCEDDTGPGPTCSHPEC